MKHIHLIFTKYMSGQVIVDCALTNGAKALERYDELRNSGHQVSYEKVAVNELDLNVFLNVWARKGGNE